jgi:hypothetical protein
MSRRAPTCNVSPSGTARESRSSTCSRSPTGTGANGKGTTYKAVLYALGDYGHAAESELFMQSKQNAESASPARMALRGKRLVVVSETERDHKLAVALMKNLTWRRPDHGTPLVWEAGHLRAVSYVPDGDQRAPQGGRRRPEPRGGRIRVIPLT